MVLLTMTPSIVEGLRSAQGPEKSQSQTDSQLDEKEPSLNSPSVGNPISHGQVVDLWKLLRDKGDRGYSLERLLQGSNIYCPPPPPKPEPSDEYKALMGRLRREEEQRAYERMTNPAPAMESFSRRFPTAANMTNAFAEANRPSREEDLGDDDVTYNDVHRQLMLILNVLLSVVGVAATLWVLARWWSTPARLFLAMGGSVLVGIAEVAVYSGYIWHLGDVNKKEKKFKEVKVIMQTWVVGTDISGGVEEKKEPVAIDVKMLPEDANLRRRKKESI
ncbi:endoplasmic reticulum-based factor for assembly of V-ATPase-domain-containing protein [Apodospora peruviana]|uniref:Endoplasmic reticulum-based factor for assembly of V-ATPase-domain-containing protein n=1 Tax=Apodospora peruviana TaxID=516989 RepID=A0AAE0HUR4_9PEZI|nr:endoplasmic reticulum-based factor for assembly of V-ATPase-domain-containing protein [Apodospora peruviana]